MLEAPLFYEIKAIALPKKTYLNLNDTFEAEISLVMVDHYAEMAVINGEIFNLENGKINYKVPASTPGKHKVKGFIKAKRRFEESVPYEFSVEYFVREK